MISIIFSKDMNFGWMNHDGHLNYHMSKEEDSKIVAPRQKAIRNKPMLHEQNKIYIYIYVYMYIYIAVYKLDEPKP